jgi:hypothetical protein
MASSRSCDGLSDLGAAIGTLIDEIDPCPAPIGLNLPDEHGRQSYAAGADHRSFFYFMMMDIGWHFGSPAQRSTLNLNPAQSSVHCGMHVINFIERRKNEPLLSLPVAFS